MARDKKIQPNIDNSNPQRYPNGRILNNEGDGKGTPVSEQTYGDFHEAFAKLMRLYDIPYNNIPDNENNGYQLVEALEALPSKNNYVLDLGSSFNVFNVKLKLGQLKNNESFILKSSIGNTGEVTIRGTLDNVHKSVTFNGNFYAGDYLRMINTPLQVILVRLIDHPNLESTVNDFGFLKSASQQEENTGVSETKATSPKTNKTVFERRVNGDDSNNYLAKGTADPNPRNGLINPTQVDALNSITDESASLLNSIKVESVSAFSLTKREQTSSNYTQFDFVDPPDGKIISNLAGFMTSVVTLNSSVRLERSKICTWSTEGNRVKIKVTFRTTSENSASNIIVRYLGIWI